MAISKKAKADLTNAVRRYNSMRTKFINKNHPTYEIPKADLQAVLKSAENTQQVREEIKALNDLKSLTDFNLSQQTELPVTVAEMRTFKRLNKTMKAQYTKQINQLKKLRETASNEDVIKITQEIQTLESKPADTGAIKNVRGFRGAIKRYKAEHANVKAFGTFKRPVDADTTQDHFIAAMRSMGLLMLPHGQEIADKIANMSAEKWFSLCKSHPTFLNLDDYIYNLSIDAYAKINALGNLFKVDITASEAVGDDEEAY